DDFGVHLAKGRTGIVAAIGRGIVRIMPHLMTLLTVVGTAAMIWVGGQIIVHGLHELGWHLPYETIHHWAVAAAAAVPFAAGAVEWVTTAFFDGIIGLILGLLLLPIVSGIINPLMQATILPLVARFSKS
ncbi:MAG: DUF808 family protein, partial [Paracoccus sp. (in: a-proteobacteria)]|nr:DUF808 family protein [Paracoccus sp. (in: a-proteobacteria)]